MKKREKQYRLKCLSSNDLKIIAMISMFLDHAGKSVFYTQYWLSYVGRLAFPIFAFLIAEGYTHTKDYDAYLKRMFVYALISEIPYNLLFGAPIYLGGCNVLFTFVIALIVIRFIDKSWSRHWLLGIVVGIVTTIIGCMVSVIISSDYLLFGVLSVVCFWAFSKMKYGRIFQILSITYINWILIAGECFTIMLGNYELWIPYQTIAVLSFIPILMYNGEIGRGGKKFRKFVYLFYPAHMALLGIVMILISNL